jgi:predicted dehydrogenase
MPAVGVRLGIIGLGYWGAMLARIAHEIPDVDLVSAWDISQGRLRTIACRYPSVRPSTSLTTFLSDPAMDAVVVATSASSHVELTARALNAGKHVFVEKPLALSSSDALALVREAQARQLVLTPGHTFLYSPAVVAIQELIANNSLGEILFISGTRVNLGIHRSDVNVAWDLAVHDLSIMQYWLGLSPTHVGAVGRSCIRGHKLDVAFINLEYATGTIGHLEVAWMAPRKSRRMLVVGSRKMVEYVDGEATSVRVFDAGAAPRPYEPSAVSYRNAAPVLLNLSDTEPILLQITDFRDAVQQGTTPRSTGALAVDVLRVLEAIDASFAAGGQRVGVAFA